MTDSMPGSRARPQLARRGRLAHQDGVEQLAAVVGVERPAAGEQLEEDDAQGPDVRGRAEQVVAAGGLLGRQVGGGAHDLAGAGQARPAVEELGQAEVGDERLAVLVQQHVGGLAVAVQDAAGVGRLDGPGDLLHQGDGGAGGRRAGPPSARPGCRRWRTAW
jgi:hypothetical protein